MECTESNFRNSNPISKNPKFWILDDIDRIFKITDYTFEMLKNFDEKSCEQDRIFEKTDYTFEKL